ncbi:hypothetical protein BDR26DRAFT_920301, partial [Obelidium mucronatum]
METTIAATVCVSTNQPPHGIQLEHKLLARSIASEALQEAIDKAIEMKLEEVRANVFADKELAAEATRQWTLYYRTHSAAYSQAVQPVFPKAYHALIGIPSLFDTLMELERTYAMAIQANLEETKELRRALIYSLENSRRSSQSSNYYDDQNRLVADSNQSQPQRRMSVAEAREELMIFDATRESLLAELRSSQKAEYRDFVIKVHNELLILANQPPTESETVTVKTHLKNTDAIASSMGKLVMEGDRVLEGAVGKLRRAPSQSLMRVGSLEGLLSGNNSGTNTPPTQEPMEPQAAAPPTSVDPEMDNLVKEVKDMGFTEDQAEAALTLSKRNLERAITLLLENPDLVDKQIRDTATRKMLFASKQPQKPALNLPAQGSGNQRSVSGGSNNELHRSSSSASLKRANSTNSNLPWNTTPRLPTQSPLANRKTGITASTEDVPPNEPRPFSPFAFIQQQQAKISADFAAIAGAATGAAPPQLAPQSASGTSTPTAQFNNLQKGFTNFLGKAMEALNIDPLPSTLQQQSKQSDSAAFDELSESYTAYFGTQVRTMYTLRVSVVPSLCDVVFQSTSSVEREAMRAQTAAGLYSNNLSGCIVLVRASDLEGYGLGRTANRAFIRKCKQATEFHFDDIEIQLKKAIDACPVDEFGRPILKEGDFFVTRHSNLPQVHVLFHLIIAEEDSIKDLSSQSDIMIGYRNILKLAHLRDINNLIVPVVFHYENNSSKAMPQDRISSSSATSSSSPPRNSAPQTPLQHRFLADNATLQRRIETVLKSTKGLIIEQTRSIKHSGDSSGIDKRSRSIQFVMTLDAGGPGGRTVSTGVEESFQVVCSKVAEVFRTS